MMILSDSLPHEALIVYSTVKSVHSAWLYFMTSSAFFMPSFS
jgi:hypothetical protein